MTDYNKTYLGRILNAVSQLGNAISGGNPDISISARIGYKSHWFGFEIPLYWKLIQKLVDFTFYPIDGEGHCQQAYWADYKEDYKLKSGSTFGLIIMTILVSVVCLLIIPFMYLYHVIRLILK